MIEIKMNKRQFPEIAGDQGKKNSNQHSVLAGLSTGTKPQLGKGAWGTKLSFLEDRAGKEVAGFQDFSQGGWGSEWGFNHNRECKCRMGPTP